MVREILREERIVNDEPLYHQHQHGMQHTHEIGKVNVPVPVGYVKETHLHAHTVLVPEQVQTTWYAGIPLLGFIGKYFLPLLIGAVLLGTTLYLLRRFAGRAQELAPRVRAKAQAVKERTRERINEQISETKEFVKEKTSGVRRRLEVDAERREQRQPTLQETIGVSHLVADTNRQEQLKNRIRYAEEDIAKVELAKQQAGLEGAETIDSIHTNGSRGLVASRLNEADRLIGATELEKHRRGVEAAIEEDRFHTLPDSQEVETVEFSGPETRSRAAKIPTKKITKTTEVEIQEPNKPTKKAKQTEVFSGGERVYKGVEINSTD